MVRAVDFGVNFSVDQFFTESFGGYEIVNSPPYISLSCFHTVAPPRIRIFKVGVKITEAVNEAAVENCCHLFTLLGSETRILRVGFRVFKVNFFVRNIQVAAVNNRLFLIKGV